MQYDWFLQLIYFVPIINDHPKLDLSSKRSVKRKAAIFVS